MADVAFNETEYLILAASYNAPDRIEDKTSDEVVVCVHRVDIRSPRKKTCLTQNKRDVNVRTWRFFAAIVEAGVEEPTTACPEVAETVKAVRCSAAAEVHCSQSPLYSNTGTDSRFC